MKTVFNTVFAVSALVMSGCVGPAGGDSGIVGPNCVLKDVPEGIGMFGSANGDGRYGIIHDGTKLTWWLAGVDLAERDACTWACEHVSCSRNNCTMRRVDNGNEYLLSRTPNGKFKLEIGPKHVNYAFPILFPVRGD